MSLSLLFYITAFVTIVSALFVVLNRNAVYSVIFLLMTFFSLAVIFLLLEAYFLAVLEILIYAGAILVLFLFVIMLLNIERERALPKVMQIQRGFSLLLILVFFIGITLLFIEGMKSITLSQEEALVGSVESVGEALFSKYLFPFEVASLLLLVALLGTVFLAKKKF